MPSQPRTRPVSRSRVRGYVGKAQEYLEAAAASLADGRYIAATSLAVHAGISDGDAICGARTGRRSADPDQARAVVLLGEAGPEGDAAARRLGRLLPLKTRAEYEPDDVPKSIATKAVLAARPRSSRSLNVRSRLPEHPYFHPYNSRHTSDSTDQRGEYNDGTSEIQRLLAARSISGRPIS